MTDVKKSSWIKVEVLICLVIFLVCLFIFIQMINKSREAVNRVVETARALDETVILLEEETKKIELQLGVRIRYEDNGYFSIFNENDKSGANFNFWAAEAVKNFKAEYGQSKNDFLVIVISTEPDDAGNDRHGGENGKPK